jgi:hypothetical protein
MRCQFPAYPGALLIAPLIDVIVVHRSMADKSIWRIWPLETKTSTPNRAVSAG